MQCRASSHDTRILNQDMSVILHQVTHDPVTPKDRLKGNMLLSKLPWKFSLQCKLAHDQEKFQNLYNLTSYFTKMSPLTETNSYSNDDCKGTKAATIYPLIFLLTVSKMS